MLATGQLVRGKNHLYKNKKGKEKGKKREKEIGAEEEEEEEAENYNIRLPNTLRSNRGTVKTNSPLEIALRHSILPLR